MGIKDLKNKVAKTMTFTRDNDNWIKDYSLRTGVPRTTVIERLLKVGIDNIKNIGIPQGNLKDTVRHNTYFLWEHWLFLESYVMEHREEGIKKAGLFNSLLAYAIQRVEGKEAIL